MHERKVALFDIDGTAYNGFLVFPLAQKQVEDGVARMNTARDMNSLLDNYRNGDASYEEMAQGVLDIWARGLEGRSASSVFEHTRDYLQGEGNKFYPYVKEVSAMLRGSHDIYFVTAGPQFTGRVTSDLFKATGFLSTEFEVESDLFTGKVASSLSESSAKLARIRSVLGIHNMEGSFAFGDSDGDVHMLESVEYAICVNPNATLQRVAQEKGWFIASPPDLIPTFVASKLKK